MAKPSRLFAVGMGKWVELRRGSKPPKIHKSEAVKVVEERIPATIRYDVYGPSYVPTSTGKRRLRIISHVYVGGKVIGILPLAKFRRVLHVGLGRQGMIELTPEQFLVIKEKLS